MADFEERDLLAAAHREVAALLFVSPKTVEHHVSAIFSKLGTRTRGETVRKAREIGALSPI